MFTINDFFDLISIGYLIAFLVAIGLVLWLVRRPAIKWAALVVIFFAFVYPLVMSYIEEKERQARNKEIAARFSALCKERAGERIARVVGGVEGLFLMRPRQPDKNFKGRNDQYWNGDPYG